MVDISAYNSGLEFPTVDMVITAGRILQGYFEKIRDRIEKRFKELGIRGKRLRVE